MSEADAIEMVDEPATVDTLASDLRTLGIEPGETLLVHSSLSALGYVVAGAPSVVDALRSAVTEDGTLVMPTFTSHYTDPTVWSNPPVPDEWIDRIVESRPAYRPAVTPTRGMGAIPECFRTYPDVIRSAHPTYSFSAWGAKAEEIVADHDLAFGLGEGSPLGRLYDRDARVCFLGTDHLTNSSLHLSEHRADIPIGTTHNRVPIEKNGQRTFVEYEELETDTDDFDALGADFEREVGAIEGSVGAASVKLFDQRALVDFGVTWLEEHRRE